MYKKIIDNFKSRLGHIQQPNTNQEIVSPQEEHEPIEVETHELQDEVVSPIHLENEEISQSHQAEELNVSDENETFSAFSIDSSESSKVYENNIIEVFIEKTIHQRHKRFKLQDFCTT